MNHNKNTPTIGEIIDVTTLAFTAHCLEDPRPTSPCFYDPPAFGSFVRISAVSGTVDPPHPISDGEKEEVDPFATPASFSPAAEVLLSSNTVYAIVCHQRMGSLDPSRRPSALGYPDQDSLLAHQPQLAELIATEFCGLLIAHTDGEGRLRRFLPPRPPRIHCRVAECDMQEVRALTAEPSFLRSLLAQSIGGLPAVPQDELAAAALRSAWAAQDHSQAYIVSAGKKLLEFLADDYERFQAIMAGIL
jgi:hypothetical protein